MGHLLRCCSNRLRKIDLRTHVATGAVASRLREVRAQRAKYRSTSGAQESTLRERGKQDRQQRDQTLREGLGHRPAEARDSYFRHPDINFSGFVAVAELDRETISGLTRAADERMSVMRRAVGKQRDTFLVACRCATLPRWVRISATAWQLGAPTASSAPS
jgi:hypothetical protein